MFEEIQDEQWNDIAAWEGQSPTDEADEVIYQEALEVVRRDFDGPIIVRKI